MLNEFTIEKIIAELDVMRLNEQQKLYLNVLLRLAYVIGDFDGYMRCSNKYEKQKLERVEYVKS